MRTSINVACYLSLAFIGFYLAVYQNAIERIKDDFHLTAAMGGMLIALHFVGMLIMPIVMGEVGDRIGKKAVLLGSWLLFAAGLLLLLVANGIGVLALGIFMIGCSYSVLESTLSSVLSDANPANPTKAITYSQMFFSFGAMTGPIIGMMAAAYAGYDFRVMFVVVLVLNAGFFIVFSRLKLDTSFSYGEKIKGSIAVKLLTRPLIGLLALSVLLYVGIENAVGFWAHALFGQAAVAGTSEAEVYGGGFVGSLAIAAFWLGMGAGRYVAGTYDRHARKLMIVGLWLALLASLISMWVRTPAAGIAAFAVIGFGFAAIWPLLVSRAVRENPRYSGTILGIMVTSSAMGGVLVPFLMGVIEDAATATAAFMLVPVILLTLIMLQRYISSRKVNARSDADG